MADAHVVDARTLGEWLAHAQQTHPENVAMGLDRVGTVARRLGVLPPAPVTIIVAGTNGKGSTAVFTESVLLALGLSVGTTLSPHLHSFNERVRVGGRACDDQTLGTAFAEVEVARSDVPLTYFEFAVLVAMVVFRRVGVDVAVLEVGLGGRLDACNLVDAQVAVITSIGMDHEAYLGNDLEAIGAEKAGVLRSRQQVVLGTPMPRSVTDRARALGCDTHRAGSEFCVDGHDGSWDFRGAGLRLEALPLGNLAPTNCAMGLVAAAAVVDRVNLEARLESPARVDRPVVLRALERASLPGRFEELVVGGRRYVLDVAHNPAAAEFLKDQLAGRYGTAACAVIGWLRDKDVRGAVRALAAVVPRVICTSVEGPRGLSAAELARRVPDQMIAGQCDELADALTHARSLTVAGDVILVAGSFAVVERARSLLMGHHTSG